MPLQILIIGGGAAGFFTAIRAAELDPEAGIVVLERGKDVLSKVRISGGGRCNVTHACWEPQELVKHYPRGGKELLGPFHHFACGDTVDWFEKRGVALKIEQDGRIFPVTDTSRTILDCLQEATERLDVRILPGERVESINPPAAESPKWKVSTRSARYEVDRVAVCSGSNPSVWQILAGLGHHIIPPVPSLFTFNVRDERIAGLPGLSVPQALVRIDGCKLEARGPLLLTHWGMSGPAILQLSAWGAREFHHRNYAFDLMVNWTDSHEEIVRDGIEKARGSFPKKQIAAKPLFHLPLRLWRNLVHAARIPAEGRWADLSKKAATQLVDQLIRSRFRVDGKSTFKEEFVTAGGIDLREVNLKTFESKLHPGLFFAGEVLNIDAVTGGFNFQAAWTGGWIAGEALVR